MHTSRPRARPPARTDDEKKKEEEEKRRRETKRRDEEEDRRTTTTTDDDDGRPAAVGHHRWLTHLDRCACPVEFTSLTVGRAGCPSPRPARVAVPCRPGGHRAAAPWSGSSKTVATFWPLPIATHFDCHPLASIRTSPCSPPPLYSLLALRSRPWPGRDGGGTGWARSPFRLVFFFGLGSPFGSSMVLVGPLQIRPPFSFLFLFLFFSAVEAPRPPAGDPSEQAPLRRAPGFHLGLWEFLFF